MILREGIAPLCAAAREAMVPVIEVRDGVSPARCELLPERLKLLLDGHIVKKLLLQRRLSCVEILTVRELSAALDDECPALRQIGHHDKTHRDRAAEPGDDRRHTVDHIDRFSTETL